MSKKTKKNEPVFSFEVNENIFVDVFEWGEDKYTVKITICDCFVVFGRVLFYKKNRKGRAFVSMPNYKNKKGEYINQCYFFDKDIVNEINSTIEDFVFDR